MRRYQLACVALFVLASISLAQEKRQAQTTDRRNVRDTEPAAAQSIKASELIGLKVKNAKDEDLGSINDLMIDLRTGEILYCALSHGGVAGIGDKMFAVPLDAFTLQTKDRQKHLVLDITKEKLAELKGFDQKTWPKVADASFGSRTIRRAYGPATMTELDLAFKQEKLETIQGAVVRVAAIQPGEAKEPRDTSRPGAKGTEDRPRESARPAQPGDTRRGTDAQRETFVELQIKTDKEDALSICLGPKSFVDDQGFQFKEGDSVIARGSRTDFRGKPTIIAAEVTRDDKTLRLRDEQGTPLWHKSTSEPDDRPATRSQKSSQSKEKP